MLPPYALRHDIADVAIFAIAATPPLITLAIAITSLPWYYATLMPLRLLRHS